MLQFPAQSALEAIGRAGDRGVDLAVEYLGNDLSRWLKPGVNATSLVESSVGSGKIVEVDCNAGDARLEPRNREGDATPHEFARGLRYFAAHAGDPKLHAETSTGANRRFGTTLESAI